MNTVLIIDRESSEIDTYKDSAVSYITAHPTSAFGLVSYASGEFTLILPATTNSSIIIAYIQSIAPAGSVTDAPSTLPEYLRSTYSQYMVFTDSNNIQKLFADKPLASLTDNEYTE